MGALDRWRIAVSISLLGCITILLITHSTSLSHPHPQHPPQQVERRLSVGYHDNEFSLGHSLNSVNSSNPSYSEHWWWDEPYNIYLYKGCKLHNMLQTRENIPPTKFHRFNQLQHWGWQNSPDNSETKIESLLKSIKTPLESIGLDVSGNAMINVESSQTESVTIDGIHYPPTQGKYFEIYNPSQGAIIAYRNYGPANRAAATPNWGETPLPALRQWSDVVFLTWLSHTTPSQRENLRYVVRLNVLNDDTRDVVEEALKKEGIRDGKAPVWPGHKFSPSNKGGKGLKPFQAVLGTPNVSGVAWLLLQHEEELGERTITAITVWDKSGMDNQGAGVLLSILIEIQGT